MNIVYLSKDKGNIFRETKMTSEELLVQYRLGTLPGQDSLKTLITSFSQEPYHNPEHSTTLLIVPASWYPKSVRTPLLVIYFGDVGTLIFKANNNVWNWYATTRYLGGKYLSKSLKRLCKDPYIKASKCAKDNLKNKRKHK